MPEISKPFLKWAGGKTKLLPELEKLLPEFIEDEKFTLIEPFVGGGAFIFWMIKNYPNIENAIINDVNTDLTNTYLSVKNKVDSIIDILHNWQHEYHNLYDDKTQAKSYYYKKRDLFNSRISLPIVQSALFIFLNRTCFNGLYRVNSKNKFTVPIGRTPFKPKICDIDNLRSASVILANVQVLNTDYSETLKYAKGKTFFYFDPPYKPLSATSNFNSYTMGEFNDKEQIRLKDFCSKLDSLDHSWMLSNSDVKHRIKDGDFFDTLFKKYKIKRVLAGRSINSKSNGRGKLNELLITNY